MKKTFVRSFYDRVIILIVQPMPVELIPSVISISYALKGLSHKTEIGCWCYGWIEHYLEMNLWYYCFLVFQLFIFFRICTARRLRLYKLFGQPSCKYIKSWWQSSGKFVTRGQRVFVHLWQICFRVSEGIGNLLTYSSQVIGNFCKYHIIARWLSTPSDHSPKGIIYYPEQLAEGIR
jgi:hypothetical protein